MSEEGAQAPRETKDTIAGRDLWRLVPYVKPYKGHVIVGLVTNGLARLFDLLPLVLIGFLIDEIRSSSVGDVGAEGFLLYGALILGTFAGLALFQTVSDYAWGALAQRVRHDLRMGLYGHLQTLDVSYFEERQTGDLMAVVSNDVDNLENFLADATTSIVRLVVTFFGIFGILLWMDWRLALLLFAPLPLAVFAIRFFAKRVQPQFRRAREAVGSMNSILENNLQGMPVIQAYTAERAQHDQLSVQSAEYRDAAVDAARTRAKFIPMLYLIAGLAFGALIAGGGYLTIRGTGPSLGEYVAFILFATRLIMPLFILGMLLNQIQRSEASAKRVFDVLDLRPRIKDDTDARPLAAAPRRLAFEEVTFAYPGRDPVLNGISFDIKQGEVLGIVGHTGAGKSTILKLLLRYYAPGGGHVSLDGRPLEEIELASLRGHIGYVSQEPFLFTGTVRENIALGSPAATDEQVAEAARVAGADEFIRDLPDGFDTLVGERGVKLSGGQRQRVSLARAVMRDPAILVLDEATSAVDTRTEELIQQNLHAYRKGRMTLAVAHRLSTIRQADRILVLVDGCVVEQGPHDDLVASGGVYTDLWRVQSGEGERAQTAPAPA